MQETPKLTDEPMHRGGKGYFQKVIGVTDNVGFFSFNPAFARTNVVDDRCDAKSLWGPMSFHSIQDGVCNCGNIDQDASTEFLCQQGYASVSQVGFAAPLVSLPPTGYICYSEMRDSSLEDLYCKHHWNCNARTLQELLKLMYEWKDSYELLGSEYPIAQVASDLLDELQIPEDVQTWIRSEVPDGPVVKYLNGDPDARVRSTNIPDIPDFVSRWLWTVVNSGFAFGEG